jgi:hypothetical protein
MRGMRADDGDLDLDLCSFSIVHSIFLLPKRSGAASLFFVHCRIYQDSIMISHMHEAGALPLVVVV